MADDPLQKFHHSVAQVPIIGESDAEAALELLGQAMDEFKASIAAQLNAFDQERIAKQAEVDEAKRRLQASIDALEHPNPARGSGVPEETGGGVGECH